MAMRTMTAATALAAAFAAVFSTAGTAMAKRDFSVRSEVRCDEAGTMCYDARSGAPFSGELRLYYPDGKVQASLFYANGRQDGKYRVFFADGGLRYSGVYKDGKPEGVLTAYYDNGKHETEPSANGGVWNGLRRSFYRDGTLRQEENYADGKRQGNAKRYYPDGSPALRVAYEQGVPVSGYCLTPQGQRIDFSADIAAFAETGKTPCDEMMAQAEKDSLPGEK